MAYEVPIAVLGTASASADLSTHQYKFVKVSGVNTVTVCAASTDQAVGVLQNKPVSGQEANFMIIGVSKVVAGAAVTAGSEVMPDASGRAITAATAGNKSVGIALETNSNANEIISVLLIGPIRTL